MKIFKYILAIGSALLLYLIFTIPSNCSEIEEFSYNEADWVTGPNTLISYDIYGTSYKRHRGETIWEELQTGLQLKPIMRYKSYVVVELPNGNRGIVTPYTLTGFKRFEIINKLKWIADNVTNYFYPGVISSLKGDDSLRFVESVSAQYVNAKLTPENRRYNDKTRPKHPELPSILAVQNDDIFLISSPHASIQPQFITNIPQFSFEFRKYVDSSDVNGFTMSEINKRYGEPQSIRTNSNGEKIAFYSQLISFDNSRSIGLSVKYDANGYSELEDVMGCTWTLQKYHDIRTYAWMTSILNLDWNDLPLLTPIVKHFHFNVYKIASSGNNEGAMLILMTIILGVVLGAAMLVIFARIKSLSNKDILLISALISSPIMLIFCGLIIEYAQSVWFISGCIALIIFSIPIFLVDSYLEFKRCNFCRSVDTVSHTRTHLKTTERYGVNYNDYSEKELSDYYDGPKRNVTGRDSMDFDHHNQRDTTDYRRKTVTRYLTKYYRLNFYCSHCGSRWNSFEDETESNVVSRSRRVTGKTTERVKGY